MILRVISSRKHSCSRRTFILCDSLHGVVSKPAESRLLLLLRNQKILKVNKMSFLASDKKAFLGQRYSQVPNILTSNAVIDVSSNYL